MKYIITLILLVIGAGAQERPNILWISVEDMSPTLGCYGDTHANTPYIDNFAKRSVLFENAFATSPVCAPSRSCLINGLPASSQGTQHMRSFQRIPEYMTGFPALLREAGYYTSNNVKTDYNSALWKTIIEKSWDESSADAHWRRRPEGKPFFSVFNLMTTHQSRSMVWPYKDFVNSVQSQLKKEEVNTIQEVPLPPYYPNTKVVRKTQARFYDCVAVMDKQVGALLEDLKKDGLAENTIVFYFSDHGTGLPRHKRALLDSGMKVPLIIHFPEKFKHLKPAFSKSAQLVNFADFAPTVLKMAGLKTPSYMEGQDIFRQGASKRKYIFGHRDRVDEVRDMARSVRSGKYLYIKNFMPHLGYNQTTGWPDKGEIRHEFYALKSTELTESLRHFIAPTRTVEELYDCEADPQNLKNLALSNDYEELIGEMRLALKSEMIKRKDLGVFPEADMVSLSEGQALYSTIRSKDLNYEEILDQAFKVGSSSEAELRQKLSSDNGSVRYWALIGLQSFSSYNSETIEALKELLSDSFESVRLEAAGVLYKLSSDSKAAEVLKSALAGKNYLAKLHATRIVELSGSHEFKNSMLSLAAEIKPYRTGPATLVRDGDADLALFIGLSQDAYFAKLEKEWRPLFNGKDLSGWHYTVPGEVKVVDGAIAILAQKKNLWLQTKSIFRDFELKAEVKMPLDGYNSGIGFRCTTTGKLHGFQCEIANEKTGSVYAIGKGWVHPEKKEGWPDFKDKAGDCYRPGEWNKIHIICKGERIQVIVNGLKTTDVTSSLFKEGSIALQHHGKGGTHYFKNIMIKELN